MNKLLDEAKNSKVFDRYMIDLYLIRGGGGAGRRQIDQGNELIC